MKLKRKLGMMNNRQYFICLPNSLVQLKGWEKGDLIIFEDVKGDIVLKKE